MAYTLLRAGGIAIGIAAALVVTGCASTPAPTIGAAASRPSAEMGQAIYSVARPTSYALRPADQISISVFREAELSLEAVRIGVEGNVSVPMVGSIPVAGMTTKQLEGDITRRLAAAGLKNPVVSVNIAEYASHLVTVEGAVDKPGVYACPSSEHLAQIAA